MIDACSHADTREPEEHCAKIESPYRALARAKGFAREQEIELGASVSVEAGWREDMTYIPRLKQ